MNRVRRSIEPRLLDRTQAAAYCGVSQIVFQRRCPVSPLSMGADKRLDRYDVRDLDEWIDRLSGRGMPADEEDWLSRMDGGNVNRARQRD